MVEVRLTEEEVERAAIMAEGKDAVMAGMNNNPTKLTVENRFYYGFLGEIALLKLLAHNNLKAVWRHHDLATKAPADFMVSQSGKRRFVDVKLASQPTHRYLMMPEYSFNAETEVDYYIGARRRTDLLIEIHGVVTRSEIAKIHAQPVFVQSQNSHVDTRMISLEKLAPIEALLRRLDKGKTLEFDLVTQQYYGAFTR